MLCECGLTKINKRCPRCDSPSLRAPSNRHRSTQRKARLRTLDETIIGVYRGRESKGERAS